MDHEVLNMAEVNISTSCASSLRPSSKSLHTHYFVSPSRILTFFALHFILHVLCNLFTVSSAVTFPKSNIFIPILLFFTVLAPLLSSSLFHYSHPFLHASTSLFHFFYLLITLPLLSSSLSHFSSFPGGTLMKQKFALGGSGSTYIYGLVDSTYRDGMTKQECQTFVKNG